MNAPTKILRLTAENFKRLTAVDITPDGAVVPISGRNAQGKSSVLDAIEAALGGKRSAPKRPVRDGEKRARIVAELDGLTVTRTFTAAGGGSLTVEAADGARYPSPQAVLDRLVSGLSFDPLGFTRIEPKRQRDMLREIVGLDTSAIDAERAALYERRTEAGREARRLEGVVSSLPHHPDTPAEPVSVAALATELQAAEEHQRMLERAKSEADKAADRLEESRRLLCDLEEQAARLHERIAKGKEHVTRLEDQRDAAWSEYVGLAATDLDRDEIAARLAGAEAINQRVRDNERRARAQGEHAEHIARVEALTRQIADCDVRKAQALDGAAFPLAGLGLDDEGVTLHGLPFEQASSAEQIRASVAIGLALHPQLRVLLVRDGSLLDEESLRLLTDLAAEAGAQVWLERVSDRDGVGVVIEDGCVREGTECPHSRDGHGHCVHWWDGDEPCCWCGDNTFDSEVSE